MKLSSAKIVKVRNTLICEKWTKKSEDREFNFHKMIFLVTWYFYRFENLEVQRFSIFSRFGMPWLNRDCQVEEKNKAFCVFFFDYFWSCVHETPRYFNFELVVSTRREKIYILFFLLNQRILGCFFGWNVQWVILFPVFQFFEFILERFVLSPIKVHHQRFP